MFRIRNFKSSTSIIQTATKRGTYLYRKASMGCFKRRNDSTVAWPLCKLGLHVFARVWNALSMVNYVDDLFAGKIQLHLKLRLAC